MQCIVEGGRGVVRMGECAGGHIGFVVYSECVTCRIMFFVGAGIFAVCSHMYELDTIRTYVHFALH